MLDPITTKNPVTRPTLLKRRARQFADHCKANRSFSHRVPDAFLDSITDQEWRIFKAYLLQFGLQQVGFDWEAK